MEKEFSRRAFSIGLARFLLMLGGVSIAQNNAPKTSSASPSAKNAKKSALRKCSIEDKVKQIIGEQLGVAESEVKPAANLVHDLGSDSLDCVELVMAFEETFDIEIPDADAERLKTVQDCIDYIKAHAKCKGTLSPSKKKHSTPRPCAPEKKAN